MASDATATGRLRGPADLGPFDFIVAARILLSTQPGADPHEVLLRHENRLRKGLDTPTTGIEPACGTAGVTCYIYDGQGALAKKIKGTETTIYAGGLFEVKKVNGQATEITKHYLFNGGRIAVRTGAPGTEGARTFLLGDQLGSTSVALGEAGQILGEQKYYAYGRLRGATPDPTVPTDKLYTGHQQEGGDLYFMQARFYDPTIGRFLSADTIVPSASDPAAFNRYAYVNGNPLRYTDPTGHSHCAITHGACQWNEEAEDWAAYGCVLSWQGAFCLPPPTAASGGGSSGGSTYNLAAEYLLWAQRYNRALNSVGCWLSHGFGRACITQEVIAAAQFAAGIPASPLPGDCPYVVSVGHGATQCRYTRPSDDPGCLICDAAGAAAGTLNEHYFSHCAAWEFAIQSSCFVDEVADGLGVDYLVPWATSRSGYCYGWLTITGVVITAAVLSPGFQATAAGMAPTLAESIATSCF
ncbi:MAG: RHS repeat-associated core domain-containing protein [Dehalococcoidia bacterium]